MATETTTNTSNGKELHIYKEVTEDTVYSNSGQNNSGFYYDSQLNDPYLSISLHANTIQDNEGHWISGKESGKKCLAPVNDEVDNENKSRYPYSACYLAEPLARCILTEDLAYSIQNNFTDFNGGNVIESMFESAKPYAPILEKLADGMKKGAGEVAKANNFGSAIARTLGNFANNFAPWMKTAGNFLNKGLMVQGTRYAYYNGTSFNLNNLEMKYTVFSDYDLYGNFFSVEDYIKKLAPYVIGKYYPSTNYKEIGDNITNASAKEFVHEYCGFQEPPAGFKMDTKNLNNVLKGTLRLNIGGTWAIENLVLRNMNVVLSKVQAKDPENPGNVVPLYADISLQLAPACVMIDTAYDRMVDHKGLVEIKQKSTDAYKTLLEKRATSFRNHYGSLFSYSGNLDSLKESTQSV